MTPDTQERAEVATKPPTKWFNWYVALTLPNGKCGKCGHQGVRKHPGEIYRGHCWLPSKDVAETVALKTDPLTSRHLGAYPEGERP